MNEILGTGFYPSEHVSAAMYHGDHTAYSKTNITHFAVSGLKMQHCRMNPPEKPAFDLGTACHTAILQPERWGKDIALQPPDIKIRRGKDWDAFKAENEGKTIITEAQNDQVDAMVKAIWSNSIAKDLLCQPNGIAEGSCFWSIPTFDHPELGICFEQGIGETHYNDLRLKCRPDYLPGEQTIVDLKTAADIDPEAFGKHAHKLKYHWSAYISCLGMQTLSNQEWNRYYFVVVEKTPPHEVAVFKCPPLLLDLARKEVSAVLLQLTVADKTKTFEGRPEAINTLHFPSWAFNQ